MMYLHWTGRAVSDNDRHRLGRGRIVATTEYKAFRDGLALMFRAQACGRKLQRPDIRIQVSISAMMDKTNLIKATCDALQIAGVVENDSEFNHSTLVMPPAIVHPRGQDDRIDIFLTGGEA
jgi:Holliday junction resolvase RusA-like endonuclease